MKKKDLFRYVTAVVFLAFLTVLAVFSVPAVRKLAEGYQEIKGVRLDFNDLKVAEDALKAI